MRNYIVIYHCAFEDVDWTVITIDGKNLQGDALNELIDQKLRTLIEEGEGPDGPYEYYVDHMIEQKCSCKPCLIGHHASWAIERD